MSLISRIFKITTDEDEYINRRAKEMGLSRSQTVRYMIGRDKHIQKHGGKYSIPINGEMTEVHGNFDPE